MVVATGLFLLVLAVYLPSRRNGFLYDDRLLILAQPALDSHAALVEIVTRPYYSGLPYYRPLTLTTFAIQKTLSGDDPVPFHVFNVLVAGCLAVLTYALFRRASFGISPWAAFLAAAVFVTHPVFSSCVHPISGRDTLLAMAFVIASVLAFMRSTRTGTWTGLGLFSLGLLTKEAAAVTPALVLLADALGLSKTRPEGVPGWLRRVAPLAAVAIAYVAVRLILFSGGELRPGAWANVPLSYLYLIQVTLVPFRALLYEPAVAAWASVPRLIAAAAILCGFGFMAARASATARAPLIFWAGWAVLALLPASNLVWQETLFDERYVAPAALGLAGAAAVMLSVRCDSRSARRTASVVGGLLVAALAAISSGRGGYFEEMAFYRQWAEVRPDSVKPRFNLANALGRRGRLAEAIAEYKAALEIDDGAARVHYNLGLAYLGTSNPERAAHHLREAVRLDPKDADARNNLGSVLAMQGDLLAAEEQFRDALRLARDPALALFNLGYLLVQKGQFEEAILRLREGLRLDPGRVEAHRSLAVALMKRGRVGEAERELREVLRLAPGDADAARLLDAWGQASRAPLPER